MLDRVLEPEMMDTPAEAAAYDCMDHTEVNTHFVEDLLGRLRLIAPTRRERTRLTVLDLGAGTALIPILLCQQLPNCRVTAVEAAASMIDLAQKHLEATCLANRITLVLSDAKQLPSDLGHFDVVMSNSLVHHLADPMSMLASAVACTAPDGLLFVRDLLRPTDKKALNHLVDTYAADATPEQCRLFADSLHAALTLDEFRDLVAELGFPRKTVKQTSNRHWTWTAARGLAE